MENYLTQITNYLLTQSWQIAVLVGVIAAVNLALKNRSAHIRYLLWLIVLAKCLVPPLLTITLAVLPQEKPAVVRFEPVSQAVAEPIVSASAPAEVPPVQLVTEKTTRFSIRQRFAICWVIGATVFVLVAVTKALRTNFWLWRQRKPIPAELQTWIENLFSDLDFRTFPKVWLVEGIGQPFVWGLLRGSIYLPANFVKVNSAEHRRGVLGHELSHILRFDAVVNILQIITQAVFWFHPFVWWANKKIRAEREKCCDEMAIARLGAKVRDYSDAIVNILISEHESTRPVPSLAVAGPVRNIEERIKTMLRPGKKFYKHPSLPAAAIVVLTALLAVPTTVVLTVAADSQPSTDSADEAPIFGNPTNLGPTVNSSAAEYDPSISADGLSLYFLSYRPGGFGGADIWVTTRKTKADPWSTPVNLGTTVNSSAPDNAPSISDDGLSLYFGSGRSGGYGGRDLWVTMRKTKSEPWGEPVNLGPTVNSPADEHAPSISVDGLSLYFSEHPSRFRPGGFGSADIWVTTRKTKDDPWGPPVNLGPTVNSSTWDESPSISADGLSLYFNSARPGGFGSTDIWVTTRKTTSDSWGTPVNVGASVNSSDWEANPDISRDGSTLYFASTRPAGSGNSDIWQVSLKANAKPAKSLHQAAADGDIEQVKLLISKGADVNEKRGLGTPLHYASEKGHTEMVKLLISQGAYVNAWCRPVGTPLHYAAIRGDRQTVELLLTKGADVNAKDWYGRKPLFVAMTSTATGRKEVVELLVAKGAKVPALNLAAYMADIEKVRKCLQDGMDINSQEDFGCAALHAAANSGNKDIVEFLISKGASVDAKDVRGLTPLYYAAMHNYEDIADLLLAKGADVNAKNKYRGGFTLLNYAIYDYGKEAIELLISKGANVNVKDDAGYTPLVYAIWENDKDVVELLISKGADVNVVDNDGYTPYYWAVMRASKDLVELLVAKGAAPIYTIHLAAREEDLAKVKRFIEEGADVNARDKDGKTPLFSAVLADSNDVAKFLIAKGADVNSKDNRGSTPINRAIRYPGRNDMVELLISSGADVNTKNNNDETPLHRACFFGLKDVAELLIAKGADVNAKDKTGVTPLYLACLVCRKDVAELLIAKGADVNMKSHRNWAPLYRVCVLGHKDVAELLIAKGADVNIKDNNSRTPLHSACLCGYKDIVELLIDKNADINAKDNKEQTALSLAKEQGHDEIVELLRKHGAKE